jgi:hypothetical protein
MTSLFASDPATNEGMLDPGCSGEGAGEVEILPFVILLLDSFTLEIDLVGITAAGVHPWKKKS